MNAAQVLDHFDRICDAPDAIPRMRRFILDLAVRGKLLEQDPNDEPVSELLKRIEEDKVRLIKEGQIVNHKPPPAIEEDKIPFKVPATWKWVRLKNVTSYIQRGKSPKYAITDGMPVVSQKCVQWHGLDLASAKLITRDSVDSYEEIRFLRNGDLLWNSTGTGTIGRIVIVREPPDRLVCDSHVTVVRCLNVDPEYVRLWLRSDHVYGLIEVRATGSTNQVELTSQMASNQIIPMPPLAEQNRIVAKVDELMALCDRLEAAQTERESQRDKVAAASLHRLNNGANADEFGDHARFHLRHLPRLTKRPDHIQQLRKTILNLAVRGKLVPQDPNDEPVTELLKRIHGGRERLLGDRKVRCAITVSPLEADEAPFEVPSSWVWVPLGHVMISRDGERIPVSKEDRNRRAKIYDYYGASGVIDKIDGFLFDKPLLLIGEDGRT
jgi:type I restriction enzyme S subunit